MEYQTGRNCEVFDGSMTKKGTELRHRHYAGSLAMYEGKPTAVGGWGMRFKSNKTEQLNEEWIELADHPR